MIPDGKGRKTMTCNSVHEDGFAKLVIVENMSFHLHVIIMAIPKVTKQRECLPTLMFLLITQSASKT